MTIDREYFVEQYFASDSYKNRNAKALVNLTDEEYLEWTKYQVNNAQRLGSIDFDREGYLERKLSGGSWS